MKTILFALIGLGGVASASDCIIDPQKVMVHASSEPLFITPEEKAREVASQEGEASAGYSREPNQYLDVLKVIPTSEPTLQRAWLEYKIMRED
jgi:hypothetical protein